jgi:tetratricopeptide (TPR) repeat protein
MGIPIDTPQDLVFDEDSIENILYGGEGRGPTPANIVELWEFGGSASEETAGALAAVLANHPDLVTHVKSLEDVERFLYEALKTAKKNKGGSSPLTASRMATLANLLQSINRMDEAEELYRQALAIQQKELGVGHEDTLRTLAGLAQLLETQGKNEEAASTRVQYAIEHLTRKGDDNSLSDLRKIALEQFLAGNYAVAEDIYHRMLERNFQVAGTSCHLARVLLMTDREKEARHQLSFGWERRAGALPYVPPRILFFQITFAFLDGEDPRLYIARLKYLLRQENTEMEWRMDPVINHLKSRLSSEVVDFLQALVAALSKWTEVSKLDRFELWYNLNLNLIDDRTL